MEMVAQVRILRPTTQLSLMLAARWLDLLILPLRCPVLPSHLQLAQFKLDDILVCGQDKDGRKELRVGFHLAR